MKHTLIALAVLLLATSTAMAQGQPAAPQQGDAAPVILNAPKPAAAGEAYAGQKPKPATPQPASPAPQATQAPPAAPAVTTGETVATPDAATSAGASVVVEGAATAAKAAADDAKPAVPEGPPVKPISKDAASAAKTKEGPERAEKGGEGTQSSGSNIPTVAKAEPPKPTLLVAIDLSKQKMTVTENGDAKFTWSISSGRSGYVTPRGTFRPVWMSKMWYSRKYDYSPMPHAIFFHGGTAIHGTDYVYALGRPASHGCVRLAPNHAATLYRLVTRHGKAKTRITVFGTPKQTPVASRREGERRHSTRQRRYQDEPWWMDEDYPPPRRRAYRERYDDRYDRPRDDYPPRPRRYVREFDGYDDYDY